PLGIGEMMAHALDVNGAAKVFILGRREASLQRVAAEAKNGSLIPIVCDVTLKDSLAAAAATISTQAPYLNAVIANSGAAGPMDAYTSNFTGTPSLSDIQKHLWSTKQEDVDATFGLNIAGSYFTFLAFLPLLEKGNTHPQSVSAAGYVSSQFITNGSIAGFSRANMIGYPYGASKAALMHLTKTLATEFAPYGIRANTIAPGLFVSEATEGITGGAPVEIPGNLAKEVNPSLRAGNKEDMAGAILYLTSRAGGFSNGSVHLVDGGGLSIRPGTY
ncbi:Short-chain dehydrogenase/reductase SAT3, partial [Lachnellula arida]